MELENQNDSNQADPAVADNGQTNDNVPEPKNVGENLNDALSNLLSNEGQPKEAQPKNGAETPTNPKEVDVDWTKDGRYGNDKMWKTPNDLYKSYRNAESQLNEFKTFKNNYENIKNTFESKGLSIEKMNDYIEEYNQLKDPNNPANKDLEILYSFLNKPEYSEKVASFFQDLRTSELQAMYPNMNSAQIQKQLELETKVKQLESQKMQEIQQKQQQELYAKQEKAVVDIKSYAESRGFSPTTEQISKFIKDTEQKGINPENLLPHFIYSFGKELDESYSKKFEESYLKRLQKNHKASIPNSTPLKSNNKSNSFMTDLERVLDM